MEEYVAALAILAIGFVPGFVCGAIVISIVCGALAAQQEEEEEDDD